MKYLILYKPRNVHWILRTISRGPFRHPVRMSVTGAVHSDIRAALKVAIDSMNSSSLTVEKMSRRLCGFYCELQQEEKAYFLLTLAQDFSVDHQVAAHLAKNFVDNVEGESMITLRLEEKLRSALLPKYSWLFSQIGRLENGVKFLVDMRTDILCVLEFADRDPSELAHLRALNVTLKDMLTLWFSVGFLTLERVTWQSSCEMLQKVSDYEAVHPIRNWTDLKRRVGPYRRCFVFTHSSMPREPIVVLHTALTNDISKTIQSIVAHPRMHSEADAFANATPMGEDPQKITTAIFYSITTSQKGLSGIELGNYLIKRVVKELQAEFPKINQFSSLSPIPGFHKWLLNELSRGHNNSDPGSFLFTPEEIENLSKRLECDDEDVYPRLKKLLVTNGWIQDEVLTRMLELPFMRLCCRYLYLEKRRGYALDSVANFHLKNGAVMWRLNWKADQSPRGLGNSCGIMVNYRYFLDATEENSAMYLENQIIQASEQILQLGRQAAGKENNPGNN